MMFRTTLTRLDIDHSSRVTEAATTDLLQYGVQLWLRSPTVYFLLPGV